jgi:hypothetical protein
MMRVHQFTIASSTFTRAKDLPEGACVGANSRDKINYENNNFSVDLESSYGKAGI